MPAQTACQVGPNSVAQNAINVPRTRMTPLVPRKLIRTNPVRKVPRMLPTIPQAYTSPIAVPVRWSFFSRSTASLATTGLTVPMVTAGRKKTSVTRNRIRYGQESAIDTGPNSSLLSRWLAAGSSRRHRRRAYPPGTQAGCPAE